MLSSCLLRTQNREDNMSKIKSNTIPYLEIDNRKLYVVEDHLSVHRRDEIGNELWWFGSNPPSGIPTPAEFIESVINSQIRQYPPPWAAIAKATDGSKKAWICTDPIGLQHLFIRYVGRDIVVGTDVFKMASFKQVHIDPISAYELMTRGNPQSGRTLFSEIKCLPPATLINIGTTVENTTYWSPPDPSPIETSKAIDIYANAVKSAVLRHWKEGDVQELTAGRDSMMILSALLNEGIPIHTWTHGRIEDPDMLGAKERASLLRVPHQAIYLEPLQEIQSEETLETVMKYLKASNGLANILEYWHLPWVLEKLEGKGSITGVGGEVFRGFYYEWAGKGRLPKWLGRFFLLHGKIREAMPFSNPIIRSDIVKKGNKVIQGDFYNSLRDEPCYWHSLDTYYLMHRMHHFAGTTFSAVSRWKNVRMPLFDPEVIDCLQMIPIELRHWSSGLVKEVTNRFLKGKSLSNSSTYSYEDFLHRITKLVKRIQQLRGTHFRGYSETLAKKVLSLEEIKGILNCNTMLTSDLYNKTLLKRYIENIENGSPIPIPLGAILTIELAAREVGSSFHGIGSIDV